MAIYELTSGTDTIVGTSGDDTVNATAATLNAGDQLTGGGGTDTLALYNSGTFRVDQLAAFTDFSGITLNNDTSGTSVLYLGNQAVSVTELGSGSDQVHLGSGTTTVHGIYDPTSFNGPYNYIYSDSSAAWNAGNAIDSINTLYLNWSNFNNGSNYDLTTNTLTNIGTVYGTAFNGGLTVKINSATAAGVSQFNFNGSNVGQLVTADATLDLSHTTVGGLTVTSTNAGGTTFTVKDLGTAMQIAGGAGQDTIIAQGFNFTAAQRDAIFHTASIEKIIDASGTYVASAPLVVTAALANDTGLSPTDAITSDSTLTGTGAANAVVHFTVDGSPIAATTTTDASGAWTFSAGLGNGTHTVVASQTDTAGNTGSASLSFTLDTTTPTIAISAVTGDNTINEAEATAGFNISGTTDAEDGQTVAVHIVDVGSSEVVASITTTVSAGTWSVNMPAGTLHRQGDGGYTVTADVSDAAGNPATQASQSVMLDETALAPSITSIAENSAGGINAGEASNGTPVVVSLTGTGAVAGDSLTVNWGGQAVHYTLLTDDITGGSATVTVTSETISVQGDGTFDVTATLTDGAGNVSANSSDFPVTVDTTADGGGDLALSISDPSINNAEKGAVAFTTSGIDADVSSATVTFSDGAHSVTINASAGVADLSGLNDGPVSSVLNVTDGAGNTASANGATIALDTTAPALTVRLASDTGSSSTDRITSNPTLTGTGDANAVVHFTVDGSAIAATTTADASGSWTFRPIGLGNGTHTVVASETDTAGNTGSASLSFTLDDVSERAPEVTAPNVLSAKGQTQFAASALFSVTDPNGDSITAYQFWDSTADPASGHWVVNGVAQTPGFAIDVTPAQLAQTTFDVGSVQDSLWVRASDGTLWSDWVNFTATPFSNHAPVVTATDPINVAHGANLLASSLFSVSDADGDAITKYQFWDSTADPASGHWVVNGVAQTTNVAIDVTAAQLGQTTFQSGSGTDDLWVRANDGTDWGAWQEFHVTAPVDAKPVVTATDPINVAHGANLLASSLFSVSDADGDAITKYQFWDSTADPASGHWVVNGVAQTTNVAIDVTAAQLGQTTFQSGSGTDDLWVRANDGTDWGAWQEFHVTAPVDAKPVVTGGDVTLALNDTVGAATLLSVTDADDAHMAAYQFWDSTVGANTAHFAINGVDQAAGQSINVLAQNIASVNLVAGSTAGTDQLWVRANDGMQWSDWHSFTAASHA